MTARRGAPHPTRRPAFTGMDIVGVSKSFGPVRALDDVSVTIKPGTIHALIGENGAGKSTLGKIVAGVIRPDQGHIAVSGQALSLRSPREALTAGIATIEQEISLVPGLTVQDNVFLGAEPRIAGVVNRRALRRRWHALVNETGFRVAGGDPAGSLSLGDQQLAEILRALSRQADLIIMDEPTAALNEQQAQVLHRTIRTIAAGGASVLIVSHFLKEVLALADIITILRDGKHVRTGPASAESESSLIRAMLGRDLSAVFPPKTVVPPTRPVVLEGAGIVAAGVAGVSLQVRAGEIVGLAGLEGSGRAELARALYGDLAIQAGSVRIGGARVGRASPRHSLTHGLSMIPASRRDDGLFLARPIAENTSISSLGDFSRGGFVRRGLESRRVCEVLGKVGVPVDRGRNPVSTLSGGNQQKVLFARPLLEKTVALIAHEPTRGVDVGAKASIYALLCSLAGQGLGVLLISSETEELIGLCHRILVLRLGQVADELTGMNICEERILTAALTGPVRSGGETP